MNLMNFIPMVSRSVVIICLYLNNCQGIAICFHGDLQTLIVFWHFPVDCCYSRTRKFETTTGRVTKRKGEKRVCCDQSDRVLRPIQAVDIIMRQF